MPKKKMSHAIQEIPMGQDATSRYVPWIIALMVFLLSLVLGGATSMSLSLHNWHASITNKLTIEVPYQEGAEGEQIVQSVLQTARTIPGVIQATIVDSNRLLNLLEPWVGRVDLLQDLKLPTLIDVELASGSSVRIEDLTGHLRQYAAGIRIEAHSRWQEMLSTLRTSLQMIAYAIAFLISATVIVTISLVTRSGLMTHRGIIDTLRVMGAHNQYIAKQFQNQAFGLSLKGSLIGAGVALPIIFALNAFSQNLGVPEILKPVFDFRLFVFILAVPCVVTLLSMLVARFSVLRTLAYLD